MKRSDAVEISYLSGQMLLEVQRLTAQRFGLVVSSEDWQSCLPERERVLLDSLGVLRTKISDKVLSLIESES